MMHNGVKRREKEVKGSERTNVQVGSNVLSLLLTPSHSLSLPIFLISLIVYLLTMDRSASWWDCGEFIATGYDLMVGHPPGAPFYQLVTHCFMLLSFGNPMWVAPLSNFVSVLCGALTVMLLYKTLILLIHRSSLTTHHSNLAAAVGALCYLFCDTVWFSAVESEVYSMAMLFCSLIVWLMLRWEQRGDHRLLALIALLLGLGVCVHLMTLLVGPFLLWVFVRKIKASKISFFNYHFSVLLLFFLLGLTPYAIIPIRASANPPINEGNPATYEDFKDYFSREQYAKAPLYPRMWRERDADHWADWGGDSPTVWGNVKYWFTYQFGYMYCRYLMYNFIGRENLKWNLIFPFVLPFLLGLLGMWHHRRRCRGDFYAVLLLFLFGGIILNIYLNHPCYEPRERDYAYVLSFYAFAIWIAFGAVYLTEKSKRWLTVLVLLAPLIIVVGNWSDHDRSDCHSVHDISMAHLQSCDQGAILFTYGDNDTFPLWYLKYVENQRPDMDIYNVNVSGFRKVMQVMEDNAFRRPVYFSQYAYDRIKDFYPGRLRCEGFCWRLLPITEGVDDREPLRRHVADSVSWHITQGEYVPWVSQSFLRIWQTNIKEL